MFTAQNVPVVQFDKMIDVQFVSFAEHELSSENDEQLKDIKFVRVDSAVADILKDDSVKEDEEKTKALCDFFKTTLDKGENFTITAQALKDATAPAVLNLSEQSRRMSDMMKMYGSAMVNMPLEETLVLNTSCPLIEKLSQKLQDENADAYLSSSSPHRVCMRNMTLRSRHKQQD